MKSLSDHAKLSRLRDENRKLTRTVKALTVERHHLWMRAKNAELAVIRLEQAEADWARRFDALLATVVKTPDVQPLIEFIRAVERGTYNECPFTCEREAGELLVKLFATVGKEQP